MTSPLERARVLLRRAVHPNTPLEEARSCALIACRDIAEFHLLDEASETFAALEQEVIRLSMKIMQLEKERDRNKPASVAPMKKYKRRARGPIVQRPLTEDESRAFGGTVVPKDWAEIDRGKK